MKKFFAFLMIVALASTLSATVYYQNYFNRAQFQPYQAELAGNYQLTVPFAYEGTISVSGYQAYDNDKYVIEKEVNGDADCVVASVRGNIPVFMTICQPCMDCFPCSEMLQKKITDNLPATFPAVGENSISGYLTRWNLYLADVHSTQVIIYKYDLIHEAEAGAANETVFYTGQKKGDAYLQAVSSLGNFAMIGRKADYTFRFYPAALLNPSATGTNKKWTVSSNTLQTAYIKSVASFQGNYCMATLLGTNDAARVFEHIAEYPALFGFQLCGTINLSRNTSVTQQLISDAYGVPAATTVATSVYNWEDCSTPQVNDANYCEMIIKSRERDNFDSWLENTKYKTYSDGVDFREGTIDGIADVLMDVVLGY